MVRKRLFCLLAACLFLAVTGCKQEPPKDAADRGPQLAVANVRVVTVSARPDGHENEVAGTVEAVRRATISAKIGGSIESMPVVLGSVGEKRGSAGEDRCRRDQCAALPGRSAPGAGQT